MRSSQTLTALVSRLRAAGMAEEADIIETEAGRIRVIETTLDAVLSGLSEPVCFPARRVPGLRQHIEHRAHAAD